MGKSALLSGQKKTNMKLGVGSATGSSDGEVDRSSVGAPEEHLIPEPSNGQVQRLQATDINS